MVYYQRMRDTLKNILRLVRRGVIPQKALQLFVYYLSQSGLSGNIAGAQDVLRFKPPEIFCLTSILKMIKVVQMVESPDGLIVQVVPSLTDQKYANILRNSGLQHKLDVLAHRIYSKSHDAFMKYGGALETIAYLVPSENRTFYMDPVKLRVLDKLAEAINIEDYVRWFVIHKLPRLKVFNLSVITHNDILAEFRRYQKDHNGDK